MLSKSSRELAKSVSGNEIEFYNLEGGLKKALLTGLLGVSAWAIKEYLPTIINTFKESLHRVITIDEDKSPELFQKVEVWLENQKRIYCSNYVVQGVANKNQVNLTVGYTPALYKIKDKICIIERSSESTKESWKKDEKIVIKVLYTKEMSVIHDIMQEIYNTDTTNENDRVQISCGWTDFYKNKRSLDTVAMDTADKEMLVQDIKKFLSDKEYYAKRGIVYKRNYMLHGEPGCGKSSLIWALASHFNMNLKLVDISEVSSVYELQRILAHSTNTFIVFEDIDAMKANVKQRSGSGRTLTKSVDIAELCECDDDDSPSEEKSISMSSLLNVFDGINTPDGSICIFTTNHIHKLDDAFLREGRMDVTIKMGKIGKTEIINNIAKNILDVEELDALEKALDDDIKIVPAKCQSIIMGSNVEEMIQKLNSEK